jgi:hypothetical protein
MPQTALSFGVLLVLVGVGFYAGTGGTSPTALIPAALGVLLAAAGLLARREGMRRQAMHAAALVGALGFLGSVRGLARLPALLSGAPVERPAAAAAQSVTALLCLAFVALCVRSFVAARRERKA